LTEEQQTLVANEIIAKQRQDGGFSMADLIGSWKRRDNTPLDSVTDGYATGLVAFAFEQANLPATKPSLERALAWLGANQLAPEGRWAATSLNKQRELSSDAGLFMSDAATAYAVLALEQ
jgi:hypothetical protein